MSQDTINQRLKNLIEALNLSVRAFSKAIDVGDTNTRNYLDRGSKPNSEYLGKVLRHFNHINPAWLLLGDGEMFLNMTSNQQTTYQKGNTGITIGTNHGTASQHYASVDECERDVTALRTENSLLRGQLQDKELIIQLLQQQLKK